MTTICNLARLRECAIHHGRDWSCVVLDPATVNALLDLAFAARAVQETYGHSHPSIANTLQAPFSVFTFEEPEPSV